MGEGDRPGFHVGLGKILVAADGDLVTAGRRRGVLDRYHGLDTYALLIKTEDGANGCGMEPLAANSGSYSTASSPLPLPLGLWTGQVEEVVTQVGSGGTTTDICIGTGLPEVPGARVPQRIDRGRCVTGEQRARRWSSLHVVRWHGPRAARRASNCRSLRHRSGECSIRGLHPAYR